MAPAAAANESPPSPKATFEGRLKLQDFIFKGASTEASSGAAMLRRSPRISTPKSTILGSPTPSPTPQRTASITGSARKRKAATAPPSASATPSSPSSLNKLSSPSPSKKRKRPKASGYAPPSTYAHLPLLPDAIAPNLLVLFVGLNPGIQTAVQGHAYAHPSNLFWKLMFSSGVLPEPVHYSEDRTLPARFRLGLTNIVARPSRNGAELSKAEMDEGVAVLEAKARRWRPEAVCIVGKSIWESVWRVRHGRAVGKHEFRYGWQDEGENMGRLGAAGVSEEEKEDGVEYAPDWRGARVFVASSTSGLAATLSPAEKEKIWRELGSWVEERRAELQKTSSSDA